jgi:hypothetical protein
LNNAPLLDATGTAFARVLSRARLKASLCANGGDCVAELLAQFGQIETASATESLLAMEMHLCQPWLADIFLFFLHSFDLFHQGESGIIRRILWSGAEVKRSARIGNKKVAQRDVSLVFLKLQAKSLKV